MKIRHLLLFTFFFPGFLNAQSNYVPLNEDYYHLIDRYQTKAGRLYDEIFTSVKPYKRSDAVAFMDSVRAHGLLESNADRFNYEYLMNDSWEWSEATTSDSRKPFWKHFYKKKSDLLYVDVPDFDLHVNPVLYLGAGSDSRLDDPVFINTRGVEIRGMVDRKVGFYTYLADNQARLPAHVQDYQSQNWVIPHEGFWKTFKEGGVDFLQARGYITFDPSRHINLQMGYDRFFVGNGERSLVLSDFAPPSFFFKGAVKVWKLNYLFFINQVKADADGGPNGSLSSRSGYPNKFTAFHHLSINIGKKLNLGVFETVIFSPDETIGTGKFEWSYLNPIIFYRAVEQQNGSTDNVLIGMDFRYHPFRRIAVYGQVVLDEFLLDNVREGNGWWGNKWALQVGAKYADAFGVSNLDLQLEGNIVRPYTYSHDTPYGNYTSYLQSMAHPLGANLKEILGTFRYQPVPRLTLAGKLIYTDIGRDGVDQNWGSDLLKPNTTREQDFDNTIAQGVSNNILWGSFTGSWMLRHNFFIDAQLVIRNSDSPEPTYNNETTISSVSLRWNIAARQYAF